MPPSFSEPLPLICPPSSSEVEGFPPFDSKQDAKTDGKTG
jgi:hypothetical protein